MSKSPTARVLLKWFACLGVLCCTSAIAQGRQHIDVAVVDEDGRPVRGLRLRSTWKRGSTIRPGSRSPRSDSAGRARVPYPSEELSVAGLFIEPVYPALTPSLTPVDRTTNRTRVILPPFGTVHLRVLDAKGHSVPGVEDVYLRPYVGPGVRHVGDPARGALSAREYGYWDGTVASFPFVPVGFEALVWCKIDGRHLPAQRILGPEKGYEHRRRDLRGIAPPPQFTGILLGLDGEPVVDEEVGLLFLGGGNFQAEVVRTGSGGRIRVTTPRVFDGLSEFHVTIVRRGSTCTEHRGAVRLQVRASCKKVNVGRIRLLLEPLLARGRVVHRGGRSVAGAVVGVPHRYAVHAKHKDCRPGAERFVYHYQLVGADGHFEFRELSDSRSDPHIFVGPGRLRSPGGFLIQEGRLAPYGAGDHEVVVVGTTVLHGSVGGVASSARRRFALDLIDEHGARPKGIRVRWRHGGKFEIDNCPPGRFRLKIGPSGRSVEVDAVIVKEGTPCRDPRLQGLALP